MICERMSENLTRTTVNECDQQTHDSTTTQPVDHVYRSGHTVIEKSNHTMECENVSPVNINSVNREKFVNCLETYVPQLRINRSLDDSIKSSIFPGEF